MYQAVVISQWIVSLTILFELAVLFRRINNKVYAYLYMLCVSMLVSAFGYLLNLVSFSEEAQFMTNQVVWAGRVFALVSSLRMSLAICRTRIPKPWDNLDFAVATATMACLTTTKQTGLFYKNVTLGTDAPWPYLIHERGPAYYIWDIFCIIVVGFCIGLYIRSWLKEKDNNRRKQIIMLTVALFYICFFNKHSP